VKDVFDAIKDETWTTLDAAEELEVISDQVSGIELSFEEGSLTK
jgi:hypothetical protein